ADPAENRSTEYPPFYSLEHAHAVRGGEILWYTTRRRSLREDDQGTEVYLSLVNLQFEPTWPSDEVLHVEVTCTNRDLPLQIAQAGQGVSWNLEMPAPINAVRCLLAPSPPLRPAARTGGYWELISHLSPSPLSLQEGPAGLAALHDMLRLYDFSDPA